MAKQMDQWHQQRDAPSLLLGEALARHQAITLGRGSHAPCSFLASNHAGLSRCEQCYPDWLKNPYVLDARPEPN